MIARQDVVSRLVLVTAQWVWRTEARIARKLLGFAAAEAGSALDMMQAAAATDDPKLRRLFFRHALDEHRHAELFRRQARQLSPDASAPSYAIAHSHDLYQRLAPADFLAFVHVAESEGRAQFLGLARHFRAHPELGPLFTRVASEELIHARYSLGLLQALERRGLIRSASWRLRRLRLQRLWQTWRRAGRRMGDLGARTLLSVVYVAAAAPCGWLVNRLERPAAGWHTPDPVPTTLADMRRLY